MTSMIGSRTVIGILITCILICGVAQAATLRIDVEDERSGVSLSGASIYIDGDYVGKTASDGTYVYDHSGKRDLRLKVARSGYQDWSDRIDRDRTKVRIDMARKDESLTVEVYDATSLQPVSGAVVRVDGDGYSRSVTTNRDGSASFSVRSGTLYDLDMRAPDYQDLSKTVQIENSGKIVQYWLFRDDLFGVKVRDAETSDPVEGAEVFVDGARKGTTDADGNLPLNLQRERRYTLKVTSPDYQAYHEDRYLEREDALITVDLSRSAYPISLTAFDDAMKPIEEAEVYFNGTLMGKTNQYGRFMLSDVDAGTYEITVRASGREDWSAVHQISGEGEDIVVELGHERANVIIRVEDVDQQIVTDAVIKVDDKDVGVTDSLGRLKTALYTGRVYSVTAVCEGYGPVSVDVEIPTGTSEFSIPLVVERAFNAWIFIGIGIVIAIVIGAILVLRRSRADSGRFRPPRGRDHL